MCVICNKFGICHLLLKLDPLLLSLANRVRAPVRYFNSHYYCSPSSSFSAHNDLHGFWLLTFNAPLLIYMQTRLQIISMVTL